MAAKDRMRLLLAIYLLLVSTTVTCASDNSPAIGGAIPYDIETDKKLSVFFQLETLQTEWREQIRLPEFARQTDWNAIGDALLKACVGTYEFVYLWVVFLSLLAVPIVRAISTILEMLLPHFITGVKAGKDYVAALDPVYQAVLAISTVLMTIAIRRGYFRKARQQYLSVRRNIQMRYRKFVGSLSAQSRIVALALPHIIYAVLAYLALQWLPEPFVRFCQNEGVVNFLAVGYPLLRSIGTIRYRRMKEVRLKKQFSQEPSSQPRSRNNKSAIKSDGSIRSSHFEWLPYESCLKYWVLWSLAVCIIALVTLFLPQFAVTALTLPMQIRTFGLIWVHSPLTRGDVTLYALLAPVINPYAHKLNATFERVRRASQPDSDDEDDANSKHNVIIRVLVATGVLPEAHVHWIKDAWAQGPALAALLFLGTPGFMTARACMLLAFGFPAHILMEALANGTKRRYEPWLAYYCVVVPVNYVYTSIGLSFSWLPFFYHIKLLVLLYLQLPYFRGAQRIFDKCFWSVFIHPEKKRPVSQDTNDL